MKTYKPTTPSRRQMKTVTYKEVLTTSKPEKSLTTGFKRGVGRNNQGRITTRHKGGGHKRSYRDIDFKYDKIDIPAKIDSVEYDPNRSLQKQLKHRLLYQSDNGRQKLLVNIQSLP